MLTKTHRIQTNREETRLISTKTSEIERKYDRALVIKARTIAKESGLILTKIQLTCVQTKKHSSKEKCECTTDPAWRARSAIAKWQVDSEIRTQRPG